MSFADNLKKTRKDKHLSQESLAEIIGVSRQAISKWEQGDTYPEIEKLLLLAKELNVSLDYLMLDKPKASDSNQTNIIIPTGKITIKAYDSKTIVSCHKIVASHVMYKPRSDEPKYWLIGKSNGSLRGESSILLGWYADEESIKEEMKEISKAINEGLPMYDLKYAVKVKNKLFRVKIDKL